MILATALEWPTLTTQWLPDKQEYVEPLCDPVRGATACSYFARFFRVPDKPYSTHRLLLGTHTSSEAQNYLQIAHVQLPNKTAPNVEEYDDDRGEIGGYGGSASRQPDVEVKFNIVQKIDHKGEVNKARYQPQNPNIIATMCTDGRVMVWDRSKHPLQPTGQVKPELELLGHEKEGFGLSWSPHSAGHLVTGSEDKTVRIWLVNL
jgi:histone-binding protein RBBP4